MTNERLSAALDDIRPLAAVQGDVAALLAAVEAALKLADEWEGSAAELDRDVAQARKSHYAGDHAQAITDHELAGTFRECAADLRETITRALTGEADGEH